MTEEVKDDELLSEEELQAKYGENDSVLETEESPKEESPDTVTETAVPVEEETTETPDTETETAEESTEETAEPTQSAFEKSGLNKTYANEEAAFEAIQAKEAEIGRLRREQTDRERYQPPDPNSQTQATNVEALKQRIQEDPDGVILQMVQFMDQTNQTVTGLQAETSIAKAEAKRPDIITNKQAIKDIIRNDAILSTIHAHNPGWAENAALDQIVAKNPKTAEPTKKKVVVQAVSDDDKAKATTTSGKGQTPKRKAGKRDQADWDGMSIEDMEKDPEIGIKED